MRIVSLSHFRMVNIGRRTLHETQTLFGHSSPSVTVRYAHLSTEALQVAASAASSRLTGKGAKAPG